MPRGHTFDGCIDQRCDPTREPTVGPKKPGAINGGFYPKKPDWPAQYPSVVISVDDLEASMKAVEKGGGKVLGEPMDIPGVGRYVSFYDTEGNRVSMLKALPRMDTRPRSE